MATSTPSFQDLWKSFYNQASFFVEKAKDTTASNETVAKQALTLLSTVVKLVFGLDEQKKSFVVQHDKGSLWLVISLVGVSGEGEEVEVEKEVTMTAIKAIRCCVVKNPAGRSLCRPSGVLEWMKKTIERLLKEEGKKEEEEEQDVVVEEAMTTMAAICMGDDLNALQAAISMRSLVKKAGEMFPEQAGLQQKLVYLNALFDAVEKEQAGLLDTADPQKFSQDAQQAEMCLHPQQQQQQKEKDYTIALDLLKPYKDTTTLLDPLLSALYEGRCHCRATDSNNWEGVLQDAEACLSLQLTTDPVALHKLRGKALQQLNRPMEAKEALGKAALMQPQDEELKQLMESLKMTQGNSSS